jgi:hypothetical protein
LEAHRITLLVEKMLRGAFRSTDIFVHQDPQVSATWTSTGAVTASSRLVAERVCFQSPRKIAIQA